MLRPQNSLRRLSGFETNLRPIIELQVTQSRAESLFLFVSEHIRVDQAKWCRKRAADEACFGKHSRKTGGKRCRNSYTAIHSGEDTLVLSGQQPAFLKGAASSGFSGFRFVPEGQQLCLTLLTLLSPEPAVTCYLQYTWRAGTRCGIWLASSRRWRGASVQRED